ncbi:hypothetical protein N7481_000801 [Penicillium waksmanii]|uniref:uncharacterized protein n=1 Tax=Penicillium waksmanii TaxID=69791 RepID=UPI0025485CBC|nr:uncharacterized protein N7481_000801 [Penicillium waksmanii]KAJ6000392.1 hypothetical protein N7481_000801 [Penicillium waksmanii]
MPCAILIVLLYRAVVAKNDPTLLRWYLSLGADPNLGPPQSSLREKGFVDKNDPPSSDSSGALAQTVINCGTDIVDILVEHGANLEKGLALRRALKRQLENRIPMMEHLLHLGIDINHFGWTLPLKYGGTALHLAACTGQIEETRWLLESGADPTISNSVKMTSDAYALLNRHEAVSRVIREWKGRKLD